MKEHKTALLFKALIKQFNIYFSKSKELGNSTSQKMKLLENARMQENFKSLEVEDIFLIDDLTAENVEFIEKFLDKTNVDLECETNFFFIVSTGQMIYLLRKIIQEYNTFLSNRKKFEA